MIDDFNESDCESWDDGKMDPHSMINIMISKIREIISEVNALRNDTSVNHK